MTSIRFRGFACDPSYAGPHTLQEMREKLQKEFEPLQCEVVDPYGDCSSIQILVVSDKFKGMLPLARHRAINSLLADEIKLIHAV